MSIPVDFAGPMNQPPRPVGRVPFRQMATHFRLRFMATLDAWFWRWSRSVSSALGCLGPLLLLGFLLSEGRLLGLEWQVGPGYRWARLPVPATGKTGFTRLDPKAMGIDFRNGLDESRMQKFQNLMNGSGLAAADVDGDGLVDLYFCHRQAPNQLYRNLGNGQFTNITLSAGVACSNQTSTGALFADFNGDGAPDLFVSGFGGPHAFFLNDGHGHFTDITRAAGLAGKSGGTSIAAADLDGNGTLDLYLCNNTVEAILRDGGVIHTQTIQGQPVVTGRYAKRLQIRNGRIEEIGEPQGLYLNDGTGHFRPAVWESLFQTQDGRPVANPPDLGLSVQIRDINGDGFPDIYTCNDFQTPDHLWLGNGHGPFREAPPQALRNMSHFSMGVDFADLDRDGFLDFFTVDMLPTDFQLKQRSIPPPLPAPAIPGDLNTRASFSRNCLYWNRGDGTWAEMACFAGVAASNWSWMPMFLDVDLDGWEDILISNGYPHDVNDRDIDDGRDSSPATTVRSTRAMLAHFPPLNPPKMALRNRHDLTFEDVSAAWGFDATEITHGMIVVDLDGDGDLDVVLNHLQGPPVLYRNDTVAPRVAVRLKGRAPNTGGVGSHITLRGGPVTQTQEIIAGGQYLSQSELLRVFAAGTPSGELTLEVKWRSGRQSTIVGVRPNCLYEIDEPDAMPTSSKTAVAPENHPLLVDATTALHHTHVESGFDDFAVQPLLPRRLSQSGPTVILADINGDGHLDVMLGAAQGGHPAVRLGNGRGEFTDLELPGPALPDDVLGLAWIPHPPRGGSLLAAMANYRTGDTHPPSVLRWDWIGNQFVVGTPIPGMGSSPGPLAFENRSGDEKGTLFVGGRVRRKRWPETPVSRLYRQRNGQFEFDLLNSGVVEKAGMVTGAVWADLDGDGPSDLIVSTEWGPIRVYHDDHGTLREQTSELGLGGTVGLWQSLAAADLDGDGRIDLVAGNWGLNSTQQIWGDGHPSIVWSDAGSDGTVAVVEAISVQGKRYPWRDRSTLAAVFPDLPGRYPTHADFARATVDDLIGTSVLKARTIRAETLSTTVFMNRGNRFEARPLPAVAQWAPAMAVVVGDINGDGHPDIFLAQNCFATRPEDDRLDAGMGLWLVGDGHGAFRPLSTRESGVQVWGEQRGAAWGDVTGDGQPDLVVTQNGAATRLFITPPKAEK
jgi:enediyne biosynthesis protein E4